MKVKALHRARLCAFVGGLLAQMSLLAQTSAPRAEPNTTPAIEDSSKTADVSGLSDLAEAVTFYRKALCLAKILSGLKSTACTLSSAARYLL
jgi:hypothetical protein